jgi:hypothetical protein
VQSCTLIPTSRRKKTSASCRSRWLGREHATAFYVPRISSPLSLNMPGHFSYYLPTKNNFKISNGTHIHTQPKHQYGLRSHCFSCFSKESRLKSSKTSSKMHIFNICTVYNRKWALTLRTERNHTSLNYIQYCFTSVLPPVIHSILFAH